MAAIINLRDVMLSTASPRALPVNMPSSYNWTGTLDGSSVSTVVGNAAAGANHSLSSGNVHNVSLSQIGGDLDSISNGSTYVKTTANERTGGGRAFNALDSTNDYIRSLVSTKLTVVGPNPSTGWVGDANGLRLYQGGILKTNLPVSGNPSFSGDITGGSNINITGNARFRGADIVGTESYAGIFNESSLADNGIHAKGKQGVVARTTQSDGNCFNGIIDGSGAAVMGMVNSGTGMGVIGISNTSSGIGVHAVNLGSGSALRVSGSMTITSSAMVNNLNAQYVGGKQVGNLCSVIATNAGTANVAGNGFQLNSTVAGTRTWSDGSNLVRIESTSDERLKKDIMPEKLGLSFINQLLPVSYRMREGVDIKYHGFIAQDVEKIISEHEHDALFQIHADGIKGTDYMCLIAPLVKAVQELSKKLEEIAKWQENAKS